MARCIGTRQNISDTLQQQRCEGTASCAGMTRDNKGDVGQADAVTELVARNCLGGIVHLDLAPCAENPQFKHGIVWKDLCNLGTLQGLLTLWS